MLGKMSVGVRTAAVTPKTTINIAITTNVYGLFKAMRTIASIRLFGGDVDRRIVTPRTRVHG